MFIGISTSIHAMKVYVAAVVGTWLLATGVWNDAGVWDDTDVWNDSAP
jgi:hypothetical protein